MLLGSWPSSTSSLVLVDLLLRRQPAQLLRRRLERERVGALNHQLPVDNHLLSVLEEEGRHGADAVRRGRLLHLVRVDLGKRQQAVDAVLRGQLRKDGGNGLAWRALRSKARREMWRMCLV